MPKNLVLFRHGHSEGNAASELARRGDESLYTPDFREKPGHRWELTPEGREQAIKAGRWVLENIGKRFDRYYVSTYIRTRQTAALLGLPDAEWRMDRRLRERDWGDVNTVTIREYERFYSVNVNNKRLDPIYWRPPGGESRADGGMRWRDFGDTLIRECAGKDVIVGTHGEFMDSARAYLEYLTDEEWVAINKDPAQKILNTHIFHYSRINPETGTEEPYINWVRRVCPSVDDSDTGWLPIVRRKYSNEQLLADADAE